MERYFEPTRGNMEEDLNIFENGRQHTFFSRQPKELTFGMQHCFNPTEGNMEDLNCFEIGR